MVGETVDTGALAAAPDLSSAAGAPAHAQIEQWLMALDRRA